MKRKGGVVVLAEAQQLWFYEGKVSQNSLWWGCCHKGSVLDYWLRLASSYSDMNLIVHQIA